MRVLITEDDFVCRKVLAAMIAPYGQADVAKDGIEAVQAVEYALLEKDPYDLIFLDIMMPNMDGQRALEEIRALEESNGIVIGNGAKIVMTTALGDSSNIMEAFRNSADGYLVKPIRKQRFLDQLIDLALIQPVTA